MPTGHVNIKKTEMFTEADKPIIYQSKRFIKIDARRRTLDVIMVGNRRGTAESQGGWVLKANRSKVRFRLPEK